MELRWGNFGYFLRDLAAKHGDRIAFSQYEKSWRTLTYSAVAEKTKSRAENLIQTGHRPGDRIALLTHTDIDLAVEILAIFSLGAVAVPLDPKLGRDELLAILNHVEARTLKVSPEFKALGQDLRAAAGTPKLLSLAEGTPLNLDAHPKMEDPDSQTTAAIFYTSGTVGSAKGVMVSGHSLLSEIAMLISFRENHAEDVMFSILPLNHLYGLVAGVLYSMACGAEYVFSHSLVPSEIARCLTDRKVTQMNAVPLLLNLVRRGILKRMQEQSPGLRALARISLRVAPYLPLSFRRQLFWPLHQKLGGHLCRAVSGAAPLDPGTFDFFRAIGIPIFEGYGLTESGPVISVNTTKRVAKGSVGQALPGVELKIHNPDETGAGEILTRGPHVMQGYFKEEALTRAAIDAEGWLHTGDRGVVKDGFLRITGRLKSLVVLASGKKVQAEELEMAIEKSPFFSDCCVLGLPSLAQGEILVAVVHPTEDFLSRPDLQAAAEAEVAMRCAALAAFKQPSRVVVKKTAFVKTSSGKVKRHTLREEIQ